MDGVRKTNVERRSGSSSLTGSSAAPLKQYGEHDPVVKKNWDQYQQENSIDRKFTEEQYGQSGIRKAQVWREEKERELYQATKDNRVGQMTRTAFAGGARNTRSAGRWVGKKLGSEAIGAKAGSYAAARVKVTAANGWIIAWVMWFYLSLQLPFALVSAAGLGMAYAVYNYIANLAITQAFLDFGGGQALPLLGDLAASAGRVIQFVAENFFGLNFNPIILFSIPFVLVLTLGILQLLMIWFIYSLLGIRSLSGKFASAKIATFVLAAVGTALPIVNLFPLILIWTMVVWFKPR